MSDPKTFLARWSRRKREAAEDPDETKSPAESGQAVASVRAAEDVPHDVAASGALESPAPTFDLTHLPAIESITADTDIRGFLAPGVPPELTRAALRRAWATDPKVRNFVGLADYDWDFNTPGSMAGFGPLEMTEELRQVVARIIGPAPVADQTGTSDAAALDDFSAKNPNKLNLRECTQPAMQGPETVSTPQDGPANTPCDMHHDDELKRHD
jgi:Protein of unknown function (DUF3306)